MHLSQKEKNFFPIFVCIFQIYIKFWTFSKKDDSRSLYISQIKNPEKRC